MDIKTQQFAHRIYLYLSGIFITSLVVSNLIFQKFFFWYPFEIEIFNVRFFELSVGILPYPITFLVTDLVSEIYGKKKANILVFTGILASFFSIGLLRLAEVVPAMPESPLDNATFSKVFSFSHLAVLASMLAYLSAQLVDIRLFHFWKRVTKGKLLWVRNNFSTFTSQLVDTLFVVGLLTVFKVLPAHLFVGLLLSGLIFKILVAIIDTPVLYFTVWLFRKKFNLKVGEELSNQ